MQKFIVVLSIWTLFSIGAVLIQSCCNPGPDFRTIDVIFGYPASIVGEKTVNGGTRKFYDLADYDSVDQSIRFDSVGLRVEISQGRISLNAESGHITTARACSPVHTYEQITAITITSDHAYDDSHPAGSDLSDILLVRQNYQNFTVAGEPPTEFRLHEFDNLFYTFNSPPVSTETHTFVIKFFMGDGRVIESTVESVKIAP
jgi:hypothetical protein